VLSVALASQALTMMSALLDDLQVETACCQESVSQGSELEIEPASLDILGQFTALQRAAKFLAAAPLNQLLFYLATISYRKVCYASFLFLVCIFLICVVFKETSGL